MRRTVRRMHLNSVAFLSSRLRRKRRTTTTPHTHAPSQGTARRALLRPPPQAGLLPRPVRHMHKGGRTLHARTYTYAHPPNTTDSASTSATRTRTHGPPQRTARTDAREEEGALYVRTTTLPRSCARSSVRGCVPIPPLIHARVRGCGVLHSTPPTQALVRGGAVGASWRCIGGVGVGAG